MPGSHCQYVAIKYYQWWNCRQNPFAEFTLIYGLQEVSLHIWYGLHTIWLFSWASEFCLPATNLPIQWSGWKMPTWAASAHSMWHYTSLSPADSQQSPYQRYCRWWLQSRHWIDKPEIQPTTRNSLFSAPSTSSCAAVCISASVLENVLAGPVGLVLTSCNSCRSWCWNDWLKSSRLTGVIWSISCSSRSFPISSSAFNHFIAACWTLFRCTQNFLCPGIVTFSAPYTWPCIAAQVWWIICSRNWWSSLANSSSTLNFGEFDIFYSPKAPISFHNPFCVWPSAVRDRSEWFCGLTSGEKIHYACIAPITIASEADSAADFQSSLEKSRIRAQFTSSLLMMPRISSPCQELLVIESNDLGNHCRGEYHGTDVNRVSNSSLTFLAFRYLSSQCNKAWTKPKSSWCDSSSCQSWYTLQRGYWQNWL